MKVLVCGGRDYSDYGVMDDVLRAFASKHEISWIIHGGARGADYLAACWAKNNNVGEMRFPADWTAHGRAAGPIRNQQMLDVAKPDIVIAFPGGHGTADMVARAKKAGVKVVDGSKETEDRT